MPCSQMLATLALPVTALALTAAPALAQQPTTSVSQRPKAEVRAAAKTIDQLVEADLAAHEQRPNPRTDDSAFVRRIYLDIVGRIPSVTETRKFLDSNASDRRAALIDELLDSPGSTSHTFNYFADLFRAKTRLARQTSGEPYIHWLKDAIKKNTPYDELVTELLTANGPAHARDNGATGYYLRDRGMPEDNMANTARVFLGTRMECAQCHNHPFDKWTQKQFYEMTAFTGGIRYQDRSSAQSEIGQQLTKLGRELRRENPQAAQALRRMTRSYVNGISGSGSGLIRLPKEYQYDDAKPLQLVAAHTAFGADAALDVAIPAPKKQSRNRGRRRRPTPPKRRTGREERLPEIDSRAAYASWLTSPANPRFTLVIANRMWKRVMGRGLIEPVDDITDKTQPSNSTLMDHLEFTMLDVGYDLKQFQRVLFNTKTYQRAASKHSPTVAETYRFPGPVLRRMTAEQLWDSVLNLVVDDIDSTLVAPEVKAERVYASFEELSNLTEEELMARIDQETVRYTDPQRYRAMQARARMERDAPAQAARAERQQELRQLRRQLVRARRGRDEQKTAELRARIEELSKRSRRGASRGLARASDQPSPAPAGHFLRQFGQSDREQIEAANSEANVPQVLTLLNGIVEQRVMQRSSAVMRELDAANTPTAAIRAAYLATLNRAPSSSEVRLWRRDVERGGEAAVRDLLWSLLNTQEFRFVQ